VCLIDLNFESVNFRLCAADKCMCGLQIELGPFGFEFSGFEFRVAGQTERAELLPATVVRAFGFHFCFFVFLVVLRDLQIIPRLSELNLEEAIIELAHGLPSRNRAAFVLCNRNEQPVELRRDIYLVFDREYA